MNPNTHKLTGRYCPFCLQALHQYLVTGLEFCPNDPFCDYEVTDVQGDKAPLTLKEKQAKQLEKVRLALADLKQQEARLLNEIAELEKACE